MESKNSDIPSSVVSDVKCITEFVTMAGTRFFFVLLNQWLILKSKLFMKSF